MMSALSPGREKMKFSQMDRNLELHRVVVSPHP